MRKLFVSALVFIAITIPAFAQTPTQSPTTEPVMEEKEEYVLPYPGILPDHPLYFLKALRDTILEALIVDPLRKSEFYLLQADKRLNMGIFFGAKGKAKEAAESVTIAEQFMERVVKWLLTFREGGSVVPASTVDRLERSMKKHEEELEGMMVNAGEGERPNIESALGKITSLQGEIGKLK